MRIIALATCYNRPAKPIRKRFTDEQIDKLLNIKWWNLPFEKIKKNHSMFGNIDEFIKTLHTQNDKNF